MNQAISATAEIEPAESPLIPGGSGKLGMWIFLVGDAMGFGCLLAAYGALRFYSDNWPKPMNVLGIQLTAVMTFLLICSSLTMVKALAAIRMGRPKAMRNFLLLTILGGTLFLGIQAYEWTHLIEIKHITLTGNPYGSVFFGTTFYLLTGFHGAHVTSGVIYLTYILIQGLRGKFSPARHGPVEIVGLYWHFVDLVWILIFTFVYLL